MFLDRDSREPCLFLYLSSCFHVVFLFITIPSDSAVLERSNNVSPNRRSVYFTIPSRVELLFCWQVLPLVMFVTGWNPRVLKMF